MGVYASIIMTAIGAGIKLLGSSQSPNYPSTPTLARIDIPKTQASMEDYEKRRMQASIDSWKAKFPLLYQGGASEIEDIANNQAGQLSPVVSGALKSSGLEADKVSQGDQYHQSVDLGLSPITMAQRTSQAVNRQIALNPEWTNKISGGTLATMIANNYQNQQAFGQFLGAQNTANYVAGQRQSAYNTAALTSGLLGTAQAGTQAYINAQNPLNSPLNPTSYRSDVNNPGYYMQPSQPPPPMAPGQSSMWNAPAPTAYQYTDTWGSGDFGAYALPTSSDPMIASNPTENPYSDLFF